MHALCPVGGHPAPCSQTASATAGELTGAIATLESLYEIDPDAAQADGTTVKQATTALEQRLRACGARSAAKRLGKLTG